MCGRYNIIDDPLTQALMSTLGISAHLTTSYNIAPTEQVPVVYRENGENWLRNMRWWLVPHWSAGPSGKYSLFNARAETLNSSKLFHRPFKQNRAILPASSFIEWQKRGKQKLPYDICPSDSAIAFAGVWDYWERGDRMIYSCTIITTEAPPQFQHIHSRIPVMLKAEEFDQWLDPTQKTKDLEHLLESRLPVPLHVIPCDTALNDTHHKQPPFAIGDIELIEI